ncbi:hypothetical protein V1L52_10585 [Treponema sp. HNW]|uniref:hypothetical protein n=1 Tax=Treponema sp. HNW TaxID=3116654 RepID=UPI003D149E85
MPFKLILFILCMIIAAVFTGFNLENSCDINFGFKRFEQVPVFLTILFSFLAGVLITLPFTFGKKRGSSAAKTEKKLFAKKEKIAKNALRKNPDEHTVLPVQNVLQPQDSAASETKKA